MVKVVEDAGDSANLKRRSDCFSSRLRDENSLLKRNDKMLL
jgi:hypothetical protein